MFKDFFTDLWLVNEADDPHLSLTLGTRKGIGLIDLSDEVAPALLIPLKPAEGQPQWPPASR